MLKECLETLRFVHRLIVGIIAATFIFALSPNPKQTAYEQLEYLNLLELAASEYNEFKKDVSVYAKQYNDKSICIAGVTEYLEDKDIAVAETNSKVATVTRSRRSSELVARRNFLGLTLDEISKRMLLPVVVDSADENSLKEALADSKLSKIPPSSNVKLHASIIATDGRFRFPAGHRSISDESDWSCIYSVFINGESFYDQVDFGVDENSIPIKSWAHWLYDNPETRTLIAKTGGSFLPFPELQDAWFELGPLTYREAKGRLKESLKVKQDALQVLGFSIEPTSALLLSPIFLFLSLLYFCTHAAHCLRVIGNDVELLRYFPWMGLYMDKIGSTIIYLSLTVLPVSSLGLLLERSHATNPFIIGSVITLIVLTLVAGAYASKLMYQIRALRSA